MYTSAYDYWDESDINFALAGQWDNRGDKLQLVMLLMALALAFAAWASLLKEESNMRSLFAIASIIVFILGILQYLAVPVVG
jgi:cation transport ATPase